ncbi:MAG: hypothetical protein WB689_31785 [Xanthobacteraceae bacterium]
MIFAAPFARSKKNADTERVEVDTTTGNFTVFLARTPRPEIDLLREVEDMLAPDEQGRAA